MNLRPPGTYAEWSDCLDVFEAGLDDNVVLSAMQFGTISWSSGVAHLFAERISSTFNVRLTRCAEQMSRELRAGGDEATLVRAMLNTRRTLALLHQVASISAFPEMLRDHLSAELKKYATRTQQSLEDSAKQDRTGRTASILRNNGLLSYDAPLPPAVDNRASNTQPMSPVSAASGSRRRNILISNE